MNSISPLHASPDPYADETPEQRDARMAWWREARFGMFIHWGVYAVPAGTYNGEQIGGIGEWIMRRATIPVAEYKQMAQEFNPTHYDPASWAALARRAGMRYMVITSKHHDGFALFPSEATDWDIEDASPYGKDLIGPLAEAARAEGLKFGLYYSQAQDWTHPGGAKSGFDEGTGWDDAHLGDFDAYLEEIAAPQVREILGRYKPDILWWDTPTWMNKERAESLLPLITAVPGIIHNNRLGGGYKGDTSTPEQHIPAKGLADRDWEVCMTMNTTWGYKSYDHDWKSTGDLLQKLSDIASKGGNFLLNVGPMADGRIPQESIDRLEEVGAWMDVNGEAIYGTTANPFTRLRWGRSTKRVTEEGTTLYLHVFDWPSDGNLWVPGLLNQPTAVTLLAGGGSLSFEQVSGEVGGLSITVPDSAPDPYVSVLRVEIGEPLRIQSVYPEQDTEGRVTLLPLDADLHSVGYGTKLQLETSHGKPNIGYWSDKRAWVEWTFKVQTPGRFKLSGEVSLVKDSEWSVTLKEAESTPTRLASTGGYGTYLEQDLGEVLIESPGLASLQLRPVKDAWNPVNVRSLTLTPLE